VEMEKTLAKYVNIFLFDKIYEFKKKDQEKTENLKKMIREEIVERVLEEAPEDEGIVFNAFIFDKLIMAEEKDNKLI
jgi:hypothetical protein